MGICVSVNESRAAVYVELNICGHSLGLYGTHLHHVNYNDTSRGARAEEMRTLLADCEQRAGAVLIAGDFNQPRLQDLLPEECKVVEAACKKFNSPKDDGVARLLQDAGFQACWDLP